MLIGTAGHIDHGKTTIVKALTGMDADRLKEEKTRGISIDLGYAFATLPNGEALAFIDVPGHERLVHNMLAGATGIDLVLLVVAADDGPMPQTREHLEILDLLGVTQGIVALTKIDRVEAGRITQATKEIDRLLEGTTLAGSPVVAVSAPCGDGIPALRAHLEAALGARARYAGEDRHFRLAVDRSFTLEGHGTIVTGTVFSGHVRLGDRLLVSPRGHEVRVRGIHAQNRATHEGHGGQRCALNLAGVDKRDVARGDWLLDPAVHAPTARLDVRLRIPAATPRALKHWTPAHLHIGTADVMAHVSLLEGTAVAPGASAHAQLVLDRPVCALWGDRLILRDQSASRTLAGGVVLDPFAPARKTRTSRRLAMLRALDQEPADAALAALLEASPDGVDLGGLARRFNLRTEAAELRSGGTPMRVITAGGNRFGFAPHHWQALERQVHDTLAAEHGRTPERLGLEARSLRRLAAPELPWELFAALLTHLIATGRVRRHGPWLHLPSHRITLGPAEERRWHDIAPLLRATPFQPPWVRDVAHVLDLPEAQVRLLLRRTALIGDTYEVLRDRFFLAEAVTRLARIVAELADANGEVRAAEFRDRVGCGRKLAIQILEYFDKTGFLRRIGDAHRVRDGGLLVDSTGPAARAPQVSGRASFPGGTA